MMMRRRKFRCLATKKTMVVTAARMMTQGARRMRMRTTTRTKRMSLGLIGWKPTTRMSQSMTLRWAHHLLSAARGPPSPVDHQQAAAQRSEAPLRRRPPLPAPPQRVLARPENLRLLPTRKGHRRRLPWVAIAFRQSWPSPYEARFWITTLPSSTLCRPTGALKSPLLREAPRLLRRLRMGMTMRRRICLHLQRAGCGPRFTSCSTVATTHSVRSRPMLLARPRQRARLTAVASRGCAIAHSQPHSETTSGGRSVRSIRSASC